MAATKYAEGTEVSVTSSKAEIERIVNKYGGSMLSFGWRSPMQAVVGFVYGGFAIKYTLDVPTDGDIREMYASSTRRSRTTLQARKDAEWRRRWRVLCLRLKLKFEVVDSDPELFAAEFMTNSVLPDGRTVGQWLEPQIEAARVSGKMPDNFLLTEGRG